MMLLMKPCLGDNQYCDKRYDELSYLVTHNAMSTSEDRWFFPNQGRGLIAQLNDGVRGLSWDIYDHDQEVYLCHGYCWLGKRKLIHDLVELKDWLDDNPREIVSIFFESYVGKKPVVELFEQSGMIDYVHHQALEQDWPSIIDMIDSGKRVVVFTSREGGSDDWYHDAWRYVWDTDFSYKSIDDFSCSRLRGPKDLSGLYSINHFLTNPLASKALAKKANPSVYERAESCWMEAGQRPNFIFVDFYSVGNTLDAVRKLNSLHF